jgi:uncharacterized protein YcbX
VRHRAPCYNESVPVTELYRYPVKSMLGERLERCRIDARGVVGDRTYALVDAETGTVASAKVPRWWAGLLDFSARCVGDPEPGAPPDVEITFPDGSVHHSGDDDLDDALTAVLGRRVHLVSTPPEGAAFEEVWPEIEGLAPDAVIAATRVRAEETGEAVSRFELAGMVSQPSFVDLAPLHLLTAGTLERLRELAPGSDFDERRYRPNVVLDTDETGFVENGWPGRAIAFGGGVSATVSIPTMRCVMTTLAQGNGLVRDPATLRTIARHNRRDIPGLGTWACAGAYADVTTPGELVLGESWQLQP